MRRSVRGFGSIVLIGLGALGMSGPWDGGRQEVVQVRLDVDLWIGAADGPEEEEFGDVIDLLQDGAGRIFVLDRLALTVRVFGNDGRYLLSFGGRGDGPGEFSELYCLAGDPANRLWISGFREFEVFHDDGSGMGPYRTMRRNAELTRGCPMFPESGGPLFPAYGDGAHGAHVELGEDGRPIRQIDLPRHVDGDILGWRKLRIRQGDGVIQENDLAPPAGPRDPLRRARDGRFGRVVTTEYRVQLYDADGAPSHEIHRAATGPELSDAERRAFRREQDSLERATRPYRVGAYPDFPIPDRHPPVRELGFDLDGRLWIELARPAEAAEAYAEVFDATGTLIFTASWPRSVRLWYGSIRDSTALGIAADGLGTQRVARLRFRRN